MNASLPENGVDAVSRNRTYQTTALKLGDFTTDRRVLLLMAIAVVVGSAVVGSAWILLKLIALCTNVAFYGRLTFAPLPISGSPFGWYMVAVPVAPSLSVTVSVAV